MLFWNILFTVGINEVSNPSKIISISASGDNGNLVCNLLNVFLGAIKMESPGCLTLFIEMFFCHIFIFSFIDNPFLLSFTLLLFIPVILSLISLDALSSALEFFSKQLSIFWTNWAIKSSVSFDSSVILLIYRSICKTCAFVLLNAASVPSAKL